MENSKMTAGIQDIFSLLAQMQTCRQLVIMLSFIKLCSLEPWLGIRRDFCFDTESAVRVLYIPCFWAKGKGACELPDSL